MEIVKVELLWSRSCPYECSGCAMPDTLRKGNTPHEGSLGQWMVGIEQMAAWGSKFVAIYGAEPLMRITHLPEVVDHIKRVGMETTLITAFPRSDMMKHLMGNCSLDSVTCSYDGIREDSDGYRNIKSANAKQYFRENLGIRDRSVVVTVTDKNVDWVPDMAQHCDSEGIWFLFDILHGSSGKLSKCSDAGPYKAPEAAKVVGMCVRLLELKRQGLKIHASESWLEYLRDKYNEDVRRTWHCQGEPVSWITVDADGSILPCDDWQKKYPGGKIWDNVNTLDLEQWLAGSVRDCPGCAWNTHFDAVRIRNGGAVSQYIH